MTGQCNISTRLIVGIHESSVQLFHLRWGNINNVRLVDDPGLNRYETAFRSESRRDLLHSIIARLVLVDWLLKDRCHHQVIN